MLLTKNFQQYAFHLQERQGFKPGIARKFAERIQDFYQSGKTAKEYAEDLYHKNKDWAASFISNYEFYNQFKTQTLYSDLRKMRVELRERYLRRKNAS